MTLKEFLNNFGEDDQCLEYIKNIKYPNGLYCMNCWRIKSFTKVKNRPAYQCGCGYQIRPLVGTIFQKSTTPLSYWFYAIFLMSKTRSGVAAKQLQRELGVTYKRKYRSIFIYHF